MSGQHRYSQPDMARLRVLTWKPLWPSRTPFKGQWRVSRRPCGFVFCSRWSLISQQRRLLKCSTLRRQRFASAWHGHASNSSNFTRLRAVKRSLTTQRPLVTWMPHKSILKSIRTIWSGLRATQGRIFLSPRHCGGTMQNDSIETLLLRHYGSTAQAPAHLENTLRASIRLEEVELEKEQQLITRLRERRVSRRHAVRLVAIGAAGLGGLSIALEGVRMIEAALLGEDITKPAYS